MLTGFLVLHQVACGGGIVSYGRRRRSAGNATEEDEGEDEVRVEVSTDGTSDTSYTFSLGTSPHSVDPPAKYVCFILEAPLNEYTYSHMKKSPQ